MSAGVLTDCKLWAGEFDWSGDMNSATLAYGCDAKDATVFGSGTHINQGGLKTVRLTSSGLFQAGTGLVDPSIFNRVGTSDVAVSAVPSAGAVGDPAYLFRALRATYNPGAQVGELIKFDTEAVASTSPLVHGAVLFNGTSTSTSSGTKVLLGAVSSTQRIYAALHVFSVPSGSSPTLDVVLQSDADASAGGETGRITFTQATTATYEWKSLAGAVTDTYWRVSITVGGTSSPTFVWALTAGII